ncbi:MAG TPA: hypothetical protein VFW11_14720 [Cyclobacteriaceae bacterium]|nr:hypothetical protein [Cyclobacteriaceae bacterium]
MKSRKIPMQLIETLTRCSNANVIVRMRAVVTSGVMSIVLSD